MTATALDAAPSALAPHERVFLGKIRTYGWVRNTIPDDDEGPGFTFSTGLWLRHRHPEIIVFSLATEIAGALITLIEQDIAEGRPPPVGEPFVGPIEDYTVMLKPVAMAHYPAYLGWSRWFYGADDFPCLQLFWPNDDGEFPWQATADEALVRGQPDLSPRGVN